MSDIDKNQDKEPAGQVEVPFWLTATDADLAAVDVEEPIRSSRSAYCGDLDNIYGKASTDAKSANNDVAERTYRMLSAVTSFHFKPTDALEPFGPLSSFGDQRSPIPSDFRGAPGAALYSLLPKLQSPVLRARIGDTCWLIDRSRSDAAFAAVEGYVALVEQARAGNLTFHDKDNGAFGFEAVSHLRRALQIGQKIGLDKEPTKAARNLVLDLRREAIGKLIGVRGLSELDLDFRISEPEGVARDIEKAIAGLGGTADPHRMIALWRLAGRAFRLAKKTDDEHRCRTEAAECFVRLADTVPSAMAKSHWLSDAIAEYQGVQGKRDRRTELRHKLVDAQAGIREEMVPMSHSTNIQDMVEATEQAFVGGNFIQKLKRFAFMAKPASPDALREQAIKLIRDHPLSSLFGVERLDSEGKTIHRSAGGGAFGTPDEDAIKLKIAQNDGMRRGLVVNGSIEIARQAIMEAHLVTEEDFQVICHNSPFIPEGHAATYARGFARFFQGDMTSAFYILTPQLESSLRHILKLNGHDVTKIDTSDMTQEDRTISSLFEQMRPEMEAILGKPMVDQIDRLFLDKTGPYLRHGAAHGLLHDNAPYGDDAIYACWLMLSLCCTFLARQWNQVEQAYNAMRAA